MITNDPKIIILHNGQYICEVQHFIMTYNIAMGVWVVCLEQDKKTRHIQKGPLGLFVERTKDI